MDPRPTRRWLRRLASVVLALIVATAGVYAWAYLSTDSSTVARALVWMDADVGDQDRFPARTIAAGGKVSRLELGDQIELTGPDGGALDEFLAEADTRAFAVVQDDRLVYERYFGGSDQGSLQTSFSVAKSVVSALVGIAIGEGVIGDVDDPVTDYLPELAERDPRFEEITLRDLLTMSSGLRYTESDFPWPRSDDTYTYYGVDLREVALQRSQVEEPAGQEWLYNNYNPLLLGLVLERATGMSVSEYTSTRLWRPLGAAADATWNLDSDESGFEKLESGLNATALDYARFGLLYLHHGRWNGDQIVPRGWIRASTTAQATTDEGDPYGYFWWVDSERPQSFYAFGNLGQYVYVDTDAEAVIVRNGSDFGIHHQDWLETFRSVADQLPRR